MKAKKQLEIIHRNGIVHGDIRDANILYTKDGKIFIIDFANSVLENESTDYMNKKTDLSELEFIFRNNKGGFE
jgi:RIO-like serine/threonine protein kinase